MLLVKYTKEDLYKLLIEYKLLYPLWISVCRYLKKFWNGTAIWPSYPIPGLYIPLKKTGTYIVYTHKDTDSAM